MGLTKISAHQNHLSSKAKPVAALAFPALKMSLYCVSTQENTEKKR
jgi:hypothetical protein